jgi:signal transduction histidine kinase
MNTTPERDAPHAAGAGPDHARPWWQRRWAEWAIVFGVWTVLAFLFTAMMYYTQLLSDKPWTWREAAKSQFLYPYIWAFGTLIVLRLARRFPLERPRVKRHLLYHFLFATLSAVIVSGGWQIINHLLFAPPDRTYTPLVTLRWIIFNSSENYGVYGLILVFSHASSYYRRYREGELRAVQLQAQLSQAQLQALKMQLHPHFLFNTLHSISALVHKDPEAADRMIARLGDFLRLTLENSGTQEVTLQKELEFLQCYLEIERIRFQDRLTTRMEIDSRSLDSRVPNLILQPIVENALRHGIAPRSTPGRIEISAKRSNGSVRIEVKDNGPGISAISATNGRFREGLGLTNTRARLEQLYGEAHRFELANDPHGGLTVTLEIPAHGEKAAA